MTTFALYSDKGPIKKVNQDACCAAIAHTPMGEVALAAVCDGVGGLALGELASATVARELLEWFEQEVPRIVRNMGDESDIQAAEVSLRGLLGCLNDLVRMYGNARDTLLGTTCTCLLLCGATYLIAHVGDCRAYRIRRGEAVQLTKDQTLVSMMVDKGEMTAQEALHSPLGNVILQSVGTSEHLRPVFCRGVLCADDVVLICSDGAYRTIGEEGLLRLINDSQDAQDDLDVSCRSIVGEAVRAGETDNISVVCLRYEPNDVLEESVTGKDSEVLPNNTVANGRGR